MMFTAKLRIKSIIRPDKLENLNNGIWYYNYDITEKPTIIRRNYEDKEHLIERTLYSYIQVRIHGIPTIDKCWEAIMKVYIDENNISLYNYNINPSKTSEITSLSDEIYFNIKVDFGLEEPLTELEKIRKRVLNQINNYDVSTEVNSFFLNGHQVWLDKATRVGLMNSLLIEKNTGKEKTTLWFNDKCITIDCDAAILMLSSLELYALSCYNQTSKHKLTVSSLKSVEAIIKYDYTEGYPSKLSFTIN